MENMNSFEIPETEVSQLRRTLEELVLQLQQTNAEYEARKPLIAARSAETDAFIKQIGENLAYVEQYLRTPLSDFRGQ